MSNVMELAVQSTEAIETINPCKGIFWMGRVNSWYQDGVIQTKKTLRVLKRKSCNGCEKCSWINEFLQEDIGLNGIEDALDNIEDGKIYQVVIDSTPDYESGWHEIDGWHLKGVKDNKTGEDDGC